MWKPNDLSWKLLGQRVWQNMQADDTFGRSAALAYYFFRSNRKLLGGSSNCFDLICEIRADMRHATDRLIAKP